MNVSIEFVGPMLAAGSDDARALWSIVALLAVVGVALLMLAVAMARVTRPDRELLAPLEVMGRRKWRRSDPVWQRRQLDQVRPPGAQPLSLSPAVPEPLAEFDAGPAAPGFDDLAEVDPGVDDDLVELPGGVAFDADPTPPSQELPVVVRERVPSVESSIAELAAGWSAPDRSDRTDVDDPPELPRRVPRRYPLEPPGFHAAEAAAVAGEPPAPGDAIPAHSPGGEQLPAEQPETAADDAPADDAPADDASAGRGPSGQSDEQPEGPVQMAFDAFAAPPPADAPASAEPPAGDRSAPADER